MTDPEPQIQESLRRASAALSTKPGRVFLPKELEQLVVANRSEWGFPSSYTAHRIIRLLETRTESYPAPLHPVTLSPAPGSTFRPVLRHVWGEASPFVIALSAKPDSYLSHGTAVFLHGLTEQIPKTIYVNKEQSEKPAPSGSLSQEGINRAFQNVPRTSNYQFELSGYRVVLLSGKNTGRLEVTQISHAGALLDVTKLERTLIDVTVRPFYAGGVHEVLAAYRSARDRVSVNTLIATLKRLSYIYPYHQAIGYYMERAGYSSDQLVKLEQLGTSFQFYLTNRLQAPTLSERWKLWVPQEL